MTVIVAENVSQKNYTTHTLHYENHDDDNCDNDGNDNSNDDDKDNDDNNNDDNNDDDDINVMVYNAYINPHLCSMVTASLSNSYTTAAAILGC